MPSWKVSPPKGDDEYFDRLSKTIFTAGLNWSMVEKKWPNFRRAFHGFSPTNEKKIRATVNNAKTILSLQKEYGSVKGYIESFGKDESELQNDVQKKFEHVGPSTARMFLWSSGCDLTPTKEEKAWMKGHHEM